MFKLNLKIALRNLWKNKGISAINIGGLAIALAAFILITIYVTYESTYDKHVEGNDRIYLVGRELPAFKTDYTSPPLAKIILNNFPEVEAAGKMKKSSFEFAAVSDSGTVFIANSLTADYEAAQMFGLAPLGGLERPSGDEERNFYLSDIHMKILFPDKKDFGPEMILLGGRNSMVPPAKVSGTIVPNKHSNIQFDALVIANNLDEHLGEGYPNYQTYIRVKAGTDIENLSQKIDKVYKENAVKQGALTEGPELSRQIIYLDKLSDLHLKPKAGNDNAYKIVMALLILGFLVLVIACINFTNLNIAQANSRAKEVGVRKVMGAYRNSLTIQFLVEIFIQCLVAMLLSLIIAEILLPQFNNLFGVSLSIWKSWAQFIWQLPLILLIISFVAGVYPALILSGFKPATVLKGNFQTSMQAQWLRKGLLTVQFTIAVVFVTGLLIISSQLNYMKSADVGFKAEQVVKIKNIAIFNDPKVFEPVRDKIMKIDGVQSATVTTVVPGGSAGGGNSYSFEGKEEGLNFIDVDFDYFETLGIELKEGRYFSENFKTDTAVAAILNESAVAKYGITNPIGKKIQGCRIDYEIVGVIKDFKTQGFEHAVEPTIYAMNNPCGNQRTQILVKVSEDKMAAVMATLKSKWMEINPKDGENFRYEFMDELYGRLFVRQSQLQTVFFGAAGLTIFIAVLGLFAFARFVTNNRKKEISVRKILGATDLQILKLLNGSFIWIVVISNCISWPLVYIISRKWLEGFAYRTEITFLPFAITGLIIIVLTLLTVSLQAAKAIKAKPIDALRYE